jgi:hypothetical protein
MDDVGVWCEAEIIRVQPAHPGIASKQQDPGDGGGGTRNLAATATSASADAADDTENIPVCVHVHFIYWGEAYDEYIECSSDRLAARGSHTFLGRNVHTDMPGSRLRVGQRVDAFDIHPHQNKWIEASIVEISDDEAKVKLHWFNYHVKFDEWVNARSLRIRPFGSMHKRSHPDWRRHQSKAEELRRQLGSAAAAHGGKAGENDDDDHHHHRRNPGAAASAQPAPPLRRCSSSSEWAQQGSVDPRFTHYRHALLQQGLLVVGADGDGNCLFRSVSRQMYGTEAHHAMIRACCMDYMLINASYFENFIEGGREEFPAYVEHKRQNAVWGDDLEIQAMGEMYRRPVHIFQYHPQHGARMLRRVQTAQQEGLEPMRLSFFGGGHYDSVERDDHRTRVLSESPGTIEARALASARATAASQSQSGDSRRGDGPEDASIMEMALRASRQAWCDMGMEQMDMAYERSLQSLTETQMIEMAKQASIAHSASSAGAGSTMQGDLEAAIAASMQDTPQMSEDALLQQALRESQSTAQSATEEEQIRQAMQLSMAGGGGVGAAGSADQVEAAMQASILEATRREHEQEELKRTLEMSQKIADDEAFQIQQVMAMSMGQSGAEFGAEFGGDSGDMELQRALAESMRK